MKKISCHTFLCSHKFHKIVNYFSFEVLKKKIWANFQRIIELFTKKWSKALKNMVLGSEIWDPGSRKNLFRILEPGGKKAPDPGSRIRIRNTEEISRNCISSTNFDLNSGKYIQPLLSLQRIILEIQNPSEFTISFM
jgi:hypothetical protein